MNKVAFQGRLSRAKTLKPGAYTMLITATNTAGQRSAPQTLLHDPQAMTTPPQSRRLFAAFWRSTESGRLATPGSTSFSRTGWARSRERKRPVNEKRAVNEKRPRQRKAPPFLGRFVELFGGCPAKCPPAVTTVPTPSAIDRALELCKPERRPPHPRLHDGYLDLLGDQDATGPHPGQRWMTSRVLPLIYERLWRPLGGRLLMGAMAPGTRGEHRIALEMLSLAGGERVLDVGCGPGNFSRSFAREASDGLVVGLDASRTMLARAAQETNADNVAYLLGDAADLPFGDASFDAVCCFAALYLIEHPMRAVDEIARVLVPGGRVALLSSCNRGLLPASVTSPVVKGLAGVRVFGRDELTRALTARGLIDVQQRVSGVAQFVAARKPG